jgi:hypothetical protein
MPSTLEDPEVQLLPCADTRFREMISSTQRCIAILSKTKVRASETEMVAREIETLRYLADLAQRALSNPCAFSKVIDIEAIQYACDEWIKRGFSTAFLRAVTVKSWMRMDMPWKDLDLSQLNQLRSGANGY